VYAVLHSTATGQNPVWTLPQKYLSTGFLFDLPTNSPTGGYDGAPSTALHAAWPDEERRPLFFIVEDKVYDAQGHLLDELYESTFAINNNIVGLDEVLIVPAPGSCKKFYIFSTQSWLAQMVRPVYGVLNLDIPSQLTLGAKGKMEALNPLDPSQTMIPLTPFSINNDIRGNVGFAAEPLSNGDFLLLVWNGIFAMDCYTIDTVGIHHLQTVDFTNALGISSGSYTFNNIVEFESRRLSNGNIRVAGVIAGNAAPVTEQLVIFDITPSGTIVNGSG
jgi:hypothetical protein